MNAHDQKMHAGISGRPKAVSSPLAFHGPKDTLKTTFDNSPYDAAKRYTGRVKWLKRALPAFGGAFILLFIALAVTTQVISTPFGVAAIDLTQGQVVMDNPSLNGFTASNATYEIVADRALQDLADPKSVSLEKIGATLTLEDGNVASIDANAGHFNLDREKLRLSKGIKLHMSSGYAADLDNAEIDIKGGVLTSEGGVAIQSAMGDISANRLEVRENGEYILFEDRVKLIIRPENVRPENVHPDTIHPDDLKN